VQDALWAILYITELTLTPVFFGTLCLRLQAMGGVDPGKLVFTKELEHFAGKSFPEILKEIAGDRSYDSFNIAGPAIVILINAAQLLHGTDAEVSYYGVRGNDIKGKAIESLLVNLPLNWSDYKTVDGETPYTDVLSDPEFNGRKDERLFVNNLGCAVQSIATLAIRRNQTEPSSD